MLSKLECWSRARSGWSGRWPLRLGLALALAGPLAGCGQASEPPSEAVRSAVSPGPTVPPIADLVGDLDGRLVVVPCAEANSQGTDCMSDGAYVIENGMSQKFNCSQSSLDVERSYPIGGDVGAQYLVTMHFYGIVEPKNYGNGVQRDAFLRPGNQDDGADPTPWAMAPGGHVYPVSDYNTYEIHVDDENDQEIAVYYLNADTQEGHWTYVIDFEKDVVVVGGGQVRVRTYDRNCRLIKNCGPNNTPANQCATEANNRILDVSAADPAPAMAAADVGGLLQPNLVSARDAASAGQWWLIDVVAAEIYDACPDDSTKTAPGGCGCGTPDTDSDGDGTADCIDGCPADPFKIQVGFCGCGTPETDTDGDGSPDCIDPCPAVPNACGETSVLLQSLVGDLDGRLVVVPCAEANSQGTDCASDGAYVIENGMSQKFNCSQGSLDVEQSYPIGGEEGAAYLLTVHFYGIMEPKNYGNGVVRDAFPRPGNQDDGADPTPWATAPGGHVYPLSDYNTYEIHVDDENDQEIAVYYVNADTQEGHWTYVIDFEKEIEVVGGGRVRVRTYDRNCRLIKNCGPNGTPANQCATAANNRILDLSATDPAPAMAAADVGGLLQPNLVTTWDAGSAGQWWLIDVVAVDACPDDPAKTLPGSCGCGTPDTDGDGDGTANCIDPCPSDPLNLCVASESAAASLLAGESLTTDTESDGATPSDPIETMVTTPVAGSVSIDETPFLGGPPTGFIILGQQIQITAPSGTVGNPLTLVFVIDGSLIPPSTALQDIAVFRNGVPPGGITACLAPPSALPNPCVLSRQWVGDDVVITVLTTNASVWTFGIAIDSDADGDGVLDGFDACPGTPAGAAVDQTGCSIPQLCPCSGPRGSRSRWRNHAKYVSCVVHAAQRLRRQHAIDHRAEHRIAQAAARSHCGRGHPRRHHRRHRPLRHRR